MGEGYGSEEGRESEEGLGRESEEGVGWGRDGRVRRE